MTGIARRGLLSLLAATPIVGPAVAQDVTGRSLLGLSGVPNLGADEDMEDDADEEYYGKTYGKGNRRSKYRSLIQSLLKEHRAFAKKPLSHYIRAVDRLDPDLQSNRSLSLTARVHQQAARNRALAINDDRATMLTQVTRYRKAMSGVG